MNYLYFLKYILRIDIEFILFYKKLLRLIFKCHKFSRRMRYMLTAVNILKYIIIKLNHIKAYYSIFLGENLVYFFIIILFFYNDIYVQSFLAICIGLDTLIKHIRKKRLFKKYNIVIKQNLLTPSLNIYYPISFSIFSVTIRITGTFLTLLLGR